MFMPANRRRLTVHALPEPRRHVHSSRNQEPNMHMQSSHSCQQDVTSPEQATALNSAVEHQRTKFMLYHATSLNTSPRLRYAFLQLNSSLEFPSNMQKKPVSAVTFSSTQKQPFPASPRQASLATNAVEFQLNSISSRIPRSMQLSRQLGQYVKPVPANSAQHRELAVCSCPGSLASTSFCSCKFSSSPKSCTTRVSHHWRHTSQRSGLVRRTALLWPCQRALLPFP